MKNPFKKENKSIEQTFLHSVLLDEAKWNKQKFFLDFSADWGISLKDSPETAKEPNHVIDTVGDACLIVSFMDVPVPNGEAEQNVAMHPRVPSLFDSQKFTLNWCGKMG